MDKIESFAEILRSVRNIHLWIYDEEGNLLNTDCSDDFRLSEELFACHSELIRKTALGSVRPAIIGSRFETIWIVDALRKNGEVSRIYAFGPFYLDSFPEKTVRREIDETSLSLPVRHRLLEAHKKLPVIPFTQVVEYVIMIHYALSGEKISVNDLHLSRPEPPYEEPVADEDAQIHGSYQEEAQMLQMVREGDPGLLDYVKTLSFSAIIGKLDNNSSDSLRQFKNTIFAAITLFSRAAIDGGLYPDTALTLADRYFQAVEASGSFQEIADINLAMQTDFVMRVHRIREDKSCSRAVRIAKEYIRLHREDEIHLQEIAQETGYTRYYLSRRFKNETGKSLGEYIRDTRLEYAKRLLKSETASVRDISERLHFASQSYFTECFRKKYGMTPNQYRQENT